MRVVCQHGYFRFYELKQGQISDFIGLTGIKLISKNDYYTFEFLEDAPEFSIKTLDLMGVPAIATFEGKPWEVFEENKVVYDFNKDLVLPILSVVQNISILRGQNMWLSPGLIIPGSLTDEGKRVKDYAAWFSRDRLTWTYTEVKYV